MLIDDLATVNSTTNSELIQGTILGAAHRMNELIDTLLNITRIEAGGIEVSPSIVNLREDRARSKLVPR